MRRLMALLTVVGLAMGVVGLLAALPAGAGGNNIPIEPNCGVPNPENGTISFEDDVTAQQPIGRLRRAVCIEVEVTKVVTGDPAPGTTFEVVVECDAPLIEPTALTEVEAVSNGPLPEGLIGPFEETLTFGEEGGTETLLVGGGDDCTVSEVPPAGCELVSIDPEEFDIRFRPVTSGEVVLEPRSLAVTVTNDCPPLEDPPAVAPVVIVTPSFTG